MFIENENNSNFKCESCWLRRKLKVSLFCWSCALASNEPLKTCLTEKNVYLQLQTLISKLFSFLPITQSSTPNCFGNSHSFVHVTTFCFVLHTHIGARVVVSQNCIFYFGVVTRSFDRCCFCLKFVDKKFFSFQV